MTEQAEKVKQEVLQLTGDERAELARLLIASLDESEDPDAEAAWNAELDRRLKRIEEGKSHLRPECEVLAEIREKYK